MDDSSFCQQKPYPCTAEYYTFTSLFDNIGGVKAHYAIQYVFAICVFRFRYESKAFC